MDTVTSGDGTRIAFERTGSGPPLVLVHGNACDHRFWDLSDVRPALAEHCTVYAMDCRGVGESGDVQQTSSAEPTRTFGSGDAAEYHLEREFEDVAAVVDVADDPVTLLGHSYGALLSLEAALRTDNVHRLVLYEPPIAVGDDELFDEAVVAEMNQLLSDGDNEEVVVLFLREIARSTPAEIDEQRAAPDWQDVVDAAHVLPRTVQAVGEYRFDGSRFANVTTPTLLLSGSESPPFLQAAVQRLDDVLPNSRVVTFEGHGHEAMLTAPDRFVEEVLAFVRDTN